MKEINEGWENVPVVKGDDLDKAYEELKAQIMYDEDLDNQLANAADRAHNANRTPWPTYTPGPSYGEGEEGGDDAEEEEDEVVEESDIPEVLQNRIREIEKSVGESVPIPPTPLFIVEDEKEPDTVMIDRLFVDHEAVPITEDMFGEYKPTGAMDAVFGTHEPVQEPLEEEEEEEEEEVGEYKPREDAYDAPDDPVEEEEEEVGEYNPREDAYDAPDDPVGEEEDVGKHDPQMVVPDRKETKEENPSKKQKVDSANEDADLSSFQYSIKTIVSLKNKLVLDVDISKTDGPKDSDLRKDVDGVILREFLGRMIVCLKTFTDTEKELFRFYVMNLVDDRLIHITIKRRVYLLFTKNVGEFLTLIVAMRKVNFFREAIREFGMRFIEKFRLSTVNDDDLLFMVLHGDKEKAFQAYNSAVHGARPESWANVNYRMSAASIYIQNGNEHLKFEDTESPWMNLLARNMNVYEAVYMALLAYNQHDKLGKMYEFGAHTYEHTHGHPTRAMSLYKRCIDDYENHKNPNRFKNDSSLVGEILRMGGTQDDIQFLIDRGFDEPMEYFIRSREYIVDLIYLLCGMINHPVETLQFLCQPQTGDVEDNDRAKRIRGLEIVMERFTSWFPRSPLPASEILTFDLEIIRKFISSAPIHWLRNDEFILELFEGLGVDTTVEVITDSQCECGYREVIEIVESRVFGENGLLGTYLIEKLPSDFFLENKGVIFNANPDNLEKNLDIIRSIVLAGKLNLAKDVREDDGILVPYLVHDYLKIRLIVYGLKMKKQASGMDYASKWFVKHGKFNYMDCENMIVAAYHSLASDDKKTNGIHAARELAQLCHDANTKVAKRVKDSDYIKNMWKPPLKVLIENGLKEEMLVYFIGMVHLCPRRIDYNQLLKGVEEPTKDRLMNLLHGL